MQTEAMAPWRGRHANPKFVRIQSIALLDLKHIPLVSSLLVASSSASPIVLRYTPKKRLTRRPRQVPFVLLGSLAATVYFASHAVYGTHGLQARSRLIERSESLEREITDLEAVRRRLRQDVALLSTEPPHPDMVEETARAVLGLALPADLIVQDRR